jgi:hypothetical protein
LANNRLYIKCDKCGEKFMLATHFLGPWSVHIQEGLGTKLDSFFEEHYFCDWGYRGTFSIELESEEDE